MLGAVLYGTKVIRFEERADPPMGHEYCGIVEDVGSAVKSIRQGQFVVGSFFASDNTCAI